jgi:hypothetical protein
MHLEIAKEGNKTYLILPMTSLLSFFIVVWLKIILESWCKEENENIWMCEIHSLMDSLRKTKITNIPSSTIFFLLLPPLSNMVVFLFWKWRSHFPTNDGRLSLDFPQIRKIIDKNFKSKTIEMSQHNNNELIIQIYRFSSLMFYKSYFHYIVKINF